MQLHQVNGVMLLYYSQSLHLLVFIIEYTTLPISGNRHLHFHIGKGLIYSNKYWPAVMKHSYYQDVLV